MFIKLLFTSLLFLNMAQASQITIAVAANVSYAIEALKQEFMTTHNDVKVRVILGSSGKLSAQIQHGAPYDLFMSANMRYPEYLYKNHMAVTKPLVYAQGALAMMSRDASNFSKGLALLKESSIKKIAIANPKTAPYGKAAYEALKNEKLYDALKGKFIYGESIAQTLSYTISAADIGIIAKSALYSPHMKKYQKGVNWVDVDTELYTPIEQGVVILKHGKNSSDVKKFYDFILSAKAQKILEDFGYIYHE